MTEVSLKKVFEEQMMGSLPLAMQSRSFARIYPFGHGWGHYLESLPKTLKMVNDQLEYTIVLLPRRNLLKFRSLVEILLP